MLDTWGIPVGWWAIAGNYMTAASLLGISALVFTSDCDGLIYLIGYLASWPIIVRAQKGTRGSIVFPN